VSIGETKYGELGGHERRSLTQAFFHTGMLDELGIFESTRLKVKIKLPGKSLLKMWSYPKEHIRRKMQTNVTKEAVGHRKHVHAPQYYTAMASKHLGKLMLTLLPAVLLLCFLASTKIVVAQDKKVAAPVDPVSKNTKRFYGGVKNFLLRSAEKVPEEYYSFKATDAVRSYGQIIGHIADTQSGMCAIVLGEKNPAGNIEKTKTSKADLIVALKGAFAYCDRAYDSMTDAAAGQMVKFRGSDTTKLGVLTANLIHSGLHYGNLITYMRLKNIVPPTSEAEYFNPPKK
jgi:hypothetical protein